MCLFNEAVGKSLLMFINESVKERVANLLQKSLNGEATDSFHLPLTKAGDMYVYIYIYVYIYRERERERKRKRECTYIYIYIHMTCLSPRPGRRRPSCC